MARTVRTFTGGAVAITQRTVVDDETVVTEVSGPACIYAEVSLIRGSLCYLRDRRRVVVPRRFHLFLPPFSLAQASLSHVAADSIGLAFRPPPDIRLPAEPLIAPFAATLLDQQVVEILKWVTDVAAVQHVGRTSIQTGLGVRAKYVLDCDYHAQASITAIATRLHSSAAALSRAFTRVYGLSPVQYRHQVRVIDAMTQLAAGRAPIDVCHEVGFDDLSRFYKVFGRLACSTPGRFRMSKNAKTEG